MAMKNFGLTKITMSIVKRQMINKEEIVPTHIIVKGLISLIFKELPEVSKRKS